MKPPAWLVDVLTRCEAEGGLDCPGCGRVTLTAEYAPTFAEWVWDWTEAIAHNTADCWVTADDDARAKLGGTLHDLMARHMPVAQYGQDPLHGWLVRT